MSKIVFLFLVASSCLLAIGSDNNATKKGQNIREKALFMNKDHYQKILKKVDEDKKKRKKEMKIYKRKDGSIDTLKTIYEANH
ncbi:MAG: hypothetical protein Q7T77_05535 [Sulfuricurvum sp.]|nr:hypothetical protein [Sulfuricurvum sp.]